MLRVPRQGGELVLSITIKSILQRAHASNQTAGMRKSSQIARNWCGAIITPDEPRSHQPLGTAFKHSSDRHMIRH